MYFELKTKKRSKLRIMLGRKYYTLNRYFEWIFGDKNYAKIRKDSDCKYHWFHHETPLYRKLKDVDMWMQYNKVDNLKLAIKHIDGMIIEPGETFSYWKSIGSPSKRKGYKLGMVIHNGSFASGYGGGLCQLSNLLYWMVIHSPLTVTERYRHSFDVFPDVNRTQPFGSGATCVYNYRDLQVTNETMERYRISVRIQGELLVGDIYSNIRPYCEYEVYEKEHTITHEPWGAYIRHNLLHKKIYDLQNELIDDTFVCENHAIMMYQPFLESNKGQNDTGIYDN